MVSLSFGLWRWRRSYAPRGCDGQRANIPGAWRIWPASIDEGPGVNDSTSKFLQGTFAFTGAGYDQPSVFAEGLTYRVPGTRRAQLIYCRGGNSSTEMVNVALLRDGKPMRHFPIGAKGAVHVPLAVVEDLEPDQTVTLLVAAPAGCSAILIIDVGLIEI